MGATAMQAVPASSSAAAGPASAASGLTPMPARWQFLLGLAAAAATIAGAHWAVQAQASPAAIRIGVFAGCGLTLWMWMVAVGVGVTGQRMGVLWSSRNTYSLSRLQIVMWTLLVLSALAGVVITRSLGLLSAGASLVNALDVYIPGELLAVMGISVASSAAAPAILSLKSQASPPSGALMERAQQRAGTVEAAGRVLVRPEGCPPLVRDIFQSDDIGNAGCVDIGKVQQAVVTLLLWSVYLAMLARMFWSGLAPLPSPSPPGIPAGGSALPALSEGFVYLLGISHAGYLAYKAAPSPSGSSDASPASIDPSAATGGPRPTPPKLK